jgi:hypothetical protein
MACVATLTGNFEIEADRMKRTAAAAFTGLAFTMFASSAFADDSPWNGSWTLDAARSSARAAQFAAPGYAFSVSATGDITWRIPALGEIALGKTDGTVMTVRRRVPTPGLALSVRAEGPLLLHYQVLKNGVAQGAGLMRIVEGGKAWVDISWRIDKPEQAGVLIYTRDVAR